jgi:hypothetical protein
MKNGKTGFAYISKYGDVPYFHSSHTAKETFARLMNADLPLFYCIKLFFWWQFYKMGRKFGIWLKNT